MNKGERESRVELSSSESHRAGEDKSPSTDAGASTLPSFIAFSAPAFSPIFKTPYEALDRL